MNITDIVVKNTGDGIKVTMKVDGKPMGVLLDASLLKDMLNADIVVPVVADKRTLAALDKLTKRYNLKDYSKTEKQVEE